MSLLASPRRNIAYATVALASARAETCEGFVLEEVSRRNHAHLGVRATCAEPVRADHRRLYAARPGAHDLVERHTAQHSEEVSARGDGEFERRFGEGRGASGHGVTGPRRAYVGQSALDPSRSAQILEAERERAGGDRGQS